MFVVLAILLLVNAASVVRVLVALVRRECLRVVLAASVPVVPREVPVVSVPVWVVPTLPEWPVVWVAPSKKC